MVQLILFLVQQLHTQAEEVVLLMERLRVLVVWAVAALVLQRLLVLRELPTQVAAAEAVIKLDQVQEAQAVQVS